MEKHPYEELIEAVADKMKKHEDDNLTSQYLHKLITAGGGHLLLGSKDSKYSDLKVLSGAVQCQ